MDKSETSNTRVYPKNGEEKANFVLQLQRLLTFVTGLIVSSIIFGFFGVAIGGLVGGNNGATIGIIIGVILATGLSVVMLSNKDRG